MMQVFLVGAGGVGKTTLMMNYLHKSSHEATFKIISEVARQHIKEVGISQSDLEDHDVFWDLQVNVAKLQLEKERMMEGKQFISDRSIVDAIVYASLCNIDRFPLLRKELLCDSQKKDSGMFIPNNAAEDLLNPLFQDSDVAHEIVDRYRNSLVVLVHPFNQKASEDDGVRKVMKGNELYEFTRRCRVVLGLLNVSFLELVDPAPAARVSALERAICSSAEDLN